MRKDIVQPFPSLPRYVYQFCLQSHFSVESNQKITELNLLFPSSGERLLLH